jgi:hypothetical protein
MMAIRPATLNGIIHHFSKFLQTIFSFFLHCYFYTAPSTKSMISSFFLHYFFLFDSLPALSLVVVLQYLATQSYFRLSHWPFSFKFEFECPFLYPCSVRSSYTSKPL